MSSVMTLIENAWSLTVVATIGLACFGLGAPLARLLRVTSDDRAANGLWSLSAGLVAAGILLTALGLVGLWYASFLALLTPIAALWGLGEAAQALYVLRDELRFGRALRTPLATDEAPALSPRWALAVASLALLAALGAFPSAVSPPTAGDALCYHLELPKNFLREHRLAMLPYDDNVTFPLLTEVWYLWALALDGPVAAQLLSYALGLLLAWATFELARPIVGPTAAVVAAGSVILLPGISNQMTAPLCDVSLALFCTLALAAWRRAMHDDEPNRWFITAGLMLGAALSIKYVALLWIVAVGLATGVVAWRGRRRWSRWCEGALTVLVVSVTISGVWYARALWHRGNPVYPFLSSWVGQAGPTEHDSKRPLSWLPSDLARAPWDITMRPERFGGRGHQVGPWLLMTLPALWAARRLRGLQELLTIPALYALLWYGLRQNTRFLWPAAPLASLAAAWALAELSRWPLTPRRLATAALSAALVGGALCPWVRSRDQWAVTLGLESRESYLSRREPSYRAAAIVNAMATPGTRILSEDFRGFYFQFPVVRESIYRRQTDYLAAMGQQPWQQCLRQQGFTHVLLAENESERGIHFDAPLSAHIAASPSPMSPGSAGATVPICLTDYRFADRDGAQRRYRLWMLR